MYKYGLKYNKEKIPVTFPRKNWIKTVYTTQEGYNAFIYYSKPLSATDERVYNLKPLGREV